MPVTEPFWLLYPDPDPPQAVVLAAPDPLPEPDPPPDPEPLPEPEPLPPPLLVVVFEGEPPHPMMTKTWSANANTQSRERKERNMRYSRYADMRCSAPRLYCPRGQWVCSVRTVRAPRRALPAARRAARGANDRPKINCFQRRIRYNHTQSRPCPVDFPSIPAHERARTGRTA